MAPVIQRINMVCHIFFFCFYELHFKNDTLYLRLEFIPSSSGTAGQKPAEICVIPVLKGPRAGTRHGFWLLEIPTSGLHSDIKI